MSLVDKDLIELAEEVFSEKFEFQGGPKIFKGISNKSWKFDALVKNADALYGMFVRDWKREISITQLRQLHKACLDVPEIQGGIMICNIVSEFSKEYCSQFGLQLLSKGHLISRIRKRSYSLGKNTEP
jgi:hypothetical protein